MSETIGSKIERLRKQKGLSRRELAEKIIEKFGGPSTAGLSQYIYQLEKGKRKPKVETLKKIAHVLGVSPSYFFEEKPKWDTNAEVLHSKIIPIPIYGEAQAGSFGGYAAETPEEYFPTPEMMFRGLPKERVFWIKVEGSSMEPVFRRGDLVLVADPSWYEVKDGDPVVVVNGNGELTVKYYHHDSKNKVIILEPANPGYKPIVIPEKDLYTGEYKFFPVIAHTKLF
ncbi:LexA family protein [Desulfurobacterium indicum]|nr:XRE family transcriptional regulator [Desulfurobacterium indicum]